MDKSKKLFSIGTFAEYTGVSIKQLRYYDKLGVLIPKVVDKETGYRYYSIEQAFLTEAITLCTAVGIPVCRIKDYINESGEFNFSRFISDGKRQAEERIRSVKNTLYYFEDINKISQRQLEYKIRNELIFEDDKILYTMERKGEPIEEEKYSIVTKLIKDAREKGYAVVYEAGELMIIDGSLCKRKFYVRIEGLNSDFAEKPENIFVVGKRRYKAIRVTRSEIDQAQELFKNELQGGGVHYIMEIIVPNAVNSDRIEYELSVSL